MQLKRKANHTWNLEGTDGNITCPCHIVMNHELMTIKFSGYWFLKIKTTWAHTFL